MASTPTPMKIRGRKRKQSLQDRPSSEPSAKQQKLKQRLEKRQREKIRLESLPANRLSRLEHLPLEILQLVFRNGPPALSLFGASPYIGALLSRELEYEWTFRQCFTGVWLKFPTATLQFVLASNSRHGAAGMGPPISKSEILGLDMPLKDNIQLINRIMNLKWFTYERVRRYSQLVLDLFAEKHLPFLKLRVDGRLMSQDELRSSLLLDLSSQRMPSRLLCPPEDSDQPVPNDQIHLLDFLHRSGARIADVDSLDGEQSLALQEHMQRHGQNGAVAILGNIIFSSSVNPTTE